MSLLTRCDWTFGDFQWQVSNLILVRPDDWHAIWVSWNSAGNPMGWYINFQRPFHRTSHGIQTMDLMLDLIVQQDMRWAWKDQDEFDALVNPGILGPVEAARVCDEAQAVLGRIEANQSPFCDPWHDWRPDPAWTTPQLPRNWHDL